MASISPDDSPSEEESVSPSPSSPSPTPTTADDNDHRCAHPGCDRSFASKAGRDNHFRIHLTDADKPFICPHPGCDMRYTGKRGADRHYNLKHTDRSNWFNCPAAECDASFSEERQLKLHQVEHGVFRCTAIRCVYECDSEQELYNHRERNHTKPDIYENRVGKKPSGTSKKRESKAPSTMSPDQVSDEEGTGDEIIVHDKQEEDEHYYDDHDEENDAFLKEAPLEDSEGYPGKEITKKPGEKTWMCPTPNCRIRRVNQFDLIAHWQDAHSEQPEPSHFALLHDPKSSDDTTTSVANTHEGQSTSILQPGRINQRDICQDNTVPLNTVVQRSSAHQQKERNANNTGRLVTATMNGLNAKKSTTSTPSIASSRSPSAPNTQNRTAHPRSRNGPPVVPPPRHAAGIARPSSSASASSLDNSSIPPTRRVVNDPRTNETTPATARPVHRRQNGPPTTFGRAVEAQRLSPPPARSNKPANTAAPLTRLNPARHATADSPRVTGNSGSRANYAKMRAQEQSQSASLASSTHSSPTGSDDEEEGLFVSPPDANKTQATGANSRVLGVRGFANMPLPRDQESDEDDLRPSHILRQERRAAAGKPEKPIGRRDKDGRWYGVNGSCVKTYGAPFSGIRGSFGNNGTPSEHKKAGKSASTASSRSNDSDDDFDIGGSELSSSSDSFGGTPRLDRRSKHRDNAPPSDSHRRRSSINNSGPPRTPSPDNDRYRHYEVYGPDLDSPPPSYLIKSPGVIDRSLPYPDREENKFLSDVAQVQPDDLFDADDIFFTFQDQTPHEIEVQARLDAEKEAMRANAYGSGFRAPMHFDHCPYTAPICRGERETWVSERKRIDATEARDDYFEDVERLLGIDRDGNRHTTSNAGTPGSSVFPKGKRATCAGPARVKRKYNWRDPDMKNKRHRGGTTRGARNSRSRGQAQVDGADEQVDTKGPSWAWSEAVGAVVNIREPVKLYCGTRPTGGTARRGGAYPGFGFRASDSLADHSAPAPANISDASTGLVGPDASGISGIYGTASTSAIASDSGEAGIARAEPAVVGNRAKTSFILSDEEVTTGSRAENNDSAAPLSRRSSF
ncbi:hypothetical protein OCU04_002207 [Sclerotinia nivalis]|uniref:C2H2-type domain-containing protein n=1 Tax=Sclerotinia nivalis TaxID=352851 RepID=A0A9X0AZN1_9HELO|nr:hypothetical protein OCU04_002207 [Sclerotinia nivalis]